MNFLFFIDNHEKFKNIKKNISSFTSRAYLVGGSVRDLVLGKTPKDFDIELYDIDEENFKKLTTSLGAKGVGKSFFVYKLGEFDLSLPRVEQKIALSHQGFKVSLCNDEKIASKRRDFTMNSLMVNIFNGELKDFWDGIRDIEHKRIKLICQQSFKEDSLRVLRGARFASKLGFLIDKKTANIMKSMDLKEISKDRIFWELEKIFISDFPGWGLLNLYKLDILEKLLLVHVDFNTIFKIAQKIEDSYKYKTKKLQPYIFLYILTNELNLDIKNSLSLLKAPKHYFHYLVNSPYIDKISDFELLKISIDLPLNSWVGVCQKGLIKRAKTLGIWDKKYHSLVLSSDVIKDGFKGKEIAKEIKRRKINEIKKSFYE